MKFDAFITRLDEEMIQKIIGKPAIQILNTLNTDLTRLRQLQGVLLNIYSPQELLKNKSIRHDLVDLLKPAEAEMFCDSLGKTAGANVYETLKRLRFTSDKEWKSLLAFFELETDEEVAEAALPASVVLQVQYPLFKHQRQAVQELNTKLYSGAKKVMLHMPTGAGKTRTAMNVICNHFRLNEPTTVIWLAHTEELCEQAFSEFEKAWDLLGNRELPVSRYWGASGEKIEQIKDGFIICGLMKLLNLLKKNAGAISQLAGNCSLVIMDEAHMAIAPTFKLNLRVLIAFQASLLGLSATPGRTWNDPEADLELSQFFDRQKVTLKIDNYTNPVDYLVDANYLAKVINAPLLYNSGFNISEADLNYLKNNFQLSDSFIKKISEDQKRNILILQKVEELVTRHQRIILFAMNVEHSNLLATCLQARGVNAFSITSNTAPSQRRSLIDRFKSEDDSPMVLCNYGILTTGFDAPKTSCAVISRPTDSLVLYSQMVGRAIRGPKAGGNAEAEIVTVVDTALPGFDGVASAFFNWEDVW